MLFKTITALFAACIICSCSKPVDIITAKSDTILIDASRDGGVWWSPQAGSFSATMPHQGKALADYLRSLGFTVKELPRGTTITWEELGKYKKVIRAVGFGNYTAQELAVYDIFLQNSSSLLLLSDHLQNSSNDDLSAHLGLNFSGSYTGTVTASNHIINTGVTGIPYIAGSVIMQPDRARMAILGYVGASSTQTGYAAMGILFHSRSRIFFSGDANGIELLPQPFTANLVKWLFQ
jgi:hypothetical protein